MEIEMEVEMEVEMDAPILPSTYTGAFCASYNYTATLAENLECLFDLYNERTSFNFVQSFCCLRILT